MDGFSGRASIVGLGYSKLERRSPRPLAHFAREAAEAAVADAGLTIEDIDGLGTIPNIAAYGNTGDLEGIDHRVGPQDGQLLGRERDIRWHVQTPGSAPTRSWRRRRRWPRERARTPSSGGR